MLVYQRVMMMFMNVEDVTCVSCGWFSMFNVSTGDVYECFKGICRDFMWDFMWDLNGTWHIWMEIFMKYHWDTNGISLNTLWYLFSKLENAPVLGKTSNSMGHGFHSYVRLQEGYVCSFLTFLKIYFFFSWNRSWTSTISMSLRPGFRRPLSFLHG